ncbi:MAG TPA: HutD family protein [Kofleriaceae bacterium]|nr:HutD family protein [Kofleriaceae bacterium]
MRIVTPAELRPQPWKNGGGVTYEIVRWPRDAGRDDYEIRISIADDRAPGPFSRFPGYRRWSFLAGPAPIVLDVGGAVHRLVARGDHIEVGGEVAITCELPAGPTRLLNILVREGVAATVGHGPCPRPIRFAFALAAMPWLSEGHAAVFEPPERVALTHDAVWLC